MKYEAVIAYSYDLQDEAAKGFGFWVTSLVTKVAVIGVIKGLHPTYEWVLYH